MVQTKCLVLSEVGHQTDRLCFPASGGFTSMLSDLGKREKVLFENSSSTIEELSTKEQLIPHISSGPVS